MNATLWVAAAVAVVVGVANVVPLLNRVKPAPTEKPPGIVPLTTNQQFKAEVARILATAGDGMTSEFKLKHLQLGSTNDAIKDDVIVVLQEQLKSRKDKEPAKA